MLILSTILILLISPLLMLTLNRLRPKFRYFWLVSMILGIVAWMGIVRVRFQMPQGFPLVSWQLGGLLTDAPMLLVDEISWPFAVSMAALGLAVILTEVGSAVETDWRNWAGVLGLLGLGLFGVLAGNPLTLLIAWAAIDLSKLFISLRRVKGAEENERVVIDFSFQVAGIVLVFWAIIAGSAPGVSLDFDKIPSNVSIFLFLAAGFRLGVIPLQVSFLRDPPLRRGFDSFLQLTPVTTSLVLLARTGTDGISAAFLPYLLIIVGVSALYGSVGWVLAKDEIEGRPYWILGIAAFVLAAGFLEKPTVSIAWGVVLLLQGGLLFLFSAKGPWLMVFPFLGGVGMSMLPYTPSWSGANIFDLSLQPWRGVFFAAHGLLLVGYARHALRERGELRNIIQGISLLYPIGLAVLLGTQFLTGWWVWLIGGREIPVGGWWQGFVSLAVAALIGLWMRQRPRASEILGEIFKRLFSFHWIYRFLRHGYRIIFHSVSFLTVLLEGEGGVLWTLLVLTLLLSLLTQVNMGR